jgi:two-component system OmpR family sensor kinase
VAGVMVASAAAVFVVVYTNTGTQLQHEIDRDLADDTVQLEHELKPLAGDSVQKIAAGALRFIRGQPYTATSTLFFVLIPGEPSASNHPDVFGGGVDTPDEAAGEQTAESREGALLRRPRLGYSTVPVPDVGKVRVLERTAQLGGLSVVLGAGEPLATVTRAQRGVARAFVLAGALSLVLALIASYFAGARVTAPLRRMASVVARVDGGDLEPRMEMAPGSGEEVRVLADAFNRMLDRLAEAFAGQRAFVADASHELRTPLTVISGQLELLASDRFPSGDDVQRVERLVQEEVARVSRLVDDLLLLTQAEQLDFLRPESIEVDSFVSDLWDGLSLTASRRFEVGEIPAGRLRADPDRLAQALRNLGRNAIEHTAPDTGLVRLEVSRVASDSLRFAVIDDGPGIPVEERDRVFERFHRTDPGRSRAAGGAGLGLAIVRAIAEAHGGTVRVLSSGGRGGAEVELVLPGYS